MASAVLGWRPGWLTAGRLPMRSRRTLMGSWTCCGACCMPWRFQADGKDLLARSVAMTAPTPAAPPLVRCSASRRSTRP